MQTLRRWAVRNAGLMEGLYSVLARLLRALGPAARLIGRRRLEAPMAAIERCAKRLLFDCRMCGQCVLATTGMACPMNCPKRVRNGPCGGVRPDGRCEVDPAMPCVWVEGWQGRQRMRAATPPGHNPALDHTRGGSSSWLAVALGRAAVGPPAAAPTTSDTPVVSRLQALLSAGKFAVTAEIAPPDTTDPAEVMRRLEVFRGSVDALNVTDGAGANCHMSSLAMSVLLLQAGCEPVMQITCRDRNRIAIQGDILGAAALGVHNLLCLTGDDVRNGDHPGARFVGDLDAVTLLAAARGMRDEARFLSERRITAPPRLFLGAADNPSAPPFEARLERLARKIAAGAQFVQTQYCFDLERLARYMQRVGALGLHRRCHILIGVGPIASARAARWLNARVPGVNIPDTIIRRLEAACDPRAEGRRICIEMIQGLRTIDGLAGVHILAPKQEEAVAEIVAGSGVLGQRVPLFHHLSAGPSVPTSISELRMCP